MEGFLYAEVRCRRPGRIGGVGAPGMEKMTSALGKTVGRSFIPYRNMLPKVIESERDQRKVCARRCNLTTAAALVAKVRHCAVNYCWLTAWKRRFDIRPLHKRLPLPRCPRHREGNSNLSVTETGHLTVLTVALTLVRHPPPPYWSHAIRPQPHCLAAPVQIHPNTLELQLPVLYSYLAPFHPSAARFTRTQRAVTHGSR
ncbi:hypothetical protein J6590_081486 [Homalodisca vitripennis]|nr:hypothetical protein J6590_081486 [Homalodisca vitripennis]